MSSKTASARPGHGRASLYDEITGKLLAGVETYLLEIRAMKLRVIGSA